MGVPALSLPPLREGERVSSYGAYPSTAPVSRETPPFKGLPLAGVRKKRKQRENPHSTVVAPPPHVDPLKSVGSSEGVTTHQPLLLILPR